MRNFVADLHVHTLLSPCAAIEMTPRNILYHAADAGVDIIAITDHNAGDNVQAALAAAKSFGITVLPGMEVETREEIHVILLFDKLHCFRQWENFVSASLPVRLNDEKRFGAQFIVDAEDNLVAVREQLLLTSLAVGIEEVATRVAELGGLCIAAHIDRPSYSLLSQLGFIPPGLALNAVEVSGRVPLQQARMRYPVIGDLPVVTSSDAHTIDDFLSGSKTTFFLEQPSLSEIRQAFNNYNQRKVVGGKAPMP